MSLKSTAKLARRIAIHEGVSAEKAIQLAIDTNVESGGLDTSEEPQLRSNLRNELLSYGQLQQYIDDPSIEEIWVNSPTGIYVAKAGIAARANLVLAEHEIQMIVERMLRPTGRRLDRSSPFVDASLPDGSRLHVVIPDITRRHWSVNIRKFPHGVLTLSQLQALGSITPRQQEILRTAVNENKNILVSGATQAGKTTLLNALLNESPDQQRIVSVEETFEIQVLKPDWVALQTRQPNLEGIGEVTLRRLIKEALRMRPDRLVVGEVREAESLDLLIALNSGLPGICTIHANSADDAIVKLCTLPLLAGQNISRDFVNPTVGSCIDVVVHCELGANGFRRVAAIKQVAWNSLLNQLEVSALE